MRRASALLLSIAFAHLAAAGCGGGNVEGGSATPHLSGVPSNAAERKSNAELIYEGPIPQDVRDLAARSFRLASEARQLPAKAPVKLRVLAPAKLVDVVRAQVAEDLPRDVVRHEGEVLAALGLIPPTYDYENETFALLEEELFGLYAAKESAMYVSSAVHEPAEIVETLTHELTHALQEQHFPHASAMKWSAGAGDKLAAIDGLSEGDATSAMIDALIHTVGPDAFEGASDATELKHKTADQSLAEKLDSLRKAGKTSKLLTTPRAVALDLVWPYVEGQSFVDALRRRGGWKAVDAAWRDPPTSTEQVLHIDKYLAKEAPIALAAPTGKALGSEYAMVHHDVMGEMMLRIALGEWMKPAVASSTATGWGGDHLALYEAKGGRHAVAWRVVYDDGGTAATALTALSTGWSNAYGPPTDSSSGADGITTLVWGAKLPTAATAPGKPGALPPLPDAAAKGPSVKTIKFAPHACRALVHHGKSLSLLASAPCASVVAWAAEVAAD